MIASIWTYGRPNSGQGARRYAPPEIPAAQSVQNQNRLSSEANLGILSSFTRKAMNTKVVDNFVPHNLDTEFALFGVRKNVRKERLRIRKVWTRLSLWKPSSLPSQGRFRQGKGEHAPRLPNDINTTPWTPKGGVLKRSNHSTDAIHQKTATAR